MSRILVLGGTGMLGHKILEYLEGEHETVATIRGALADHPAADHFEEHRIIEGFDASDLDAAAALVLGEAPETVINCVGLIKQRPEALDPVASITINSLLPHVLAAACSEAEARLILFSTDCVFSGRRGGYKEDDPSDAEDLYGRTKYLGEVGDAGHVVTLRTSIVGRQLTGSESLIEWFLSQEGTVPGFTRAMYSGVTTNEMAGTVSQLVNNPARHGLYHVAGPVISKHDLLVLVRDAYGKDIEIVPDDSLVIDRTLDDSRFREATGLPAPSWPDMISFMAAEPTPYHLWR